MCKYKQFQPVLLAQAECVSCFMCFAQCSNESVFAVDFHPTDSNIIVTCGKSHLYFWHLEKGMLVKKQGLFEVSCQALSHMLEP